MYSIGDEFSTPTMYQDIGSMTTGPMGMPFGAGVYGGGLYPSYLGGVRMQGQPDNDKFTVMQQKDNEDKHTAKKALKVLGVLIGISLIAPICKSYKKAGSLTKFLENQWNATKKFFGFKKSNLTP